ncbi:MAG: alpha/beta hydrolase [Marmoricola sp.]|jgi:alpha-beta hydrolase superfamily lysophospholipase|nr:alpha/beta hydrolase [Marmoricola sp.]
MPEPETDLLGAPYTRETLQLRPDAEGEVVATLVHRRAEAPTRKAVLHVHGFCDYFFQTVAADFWVRNGYDFYAVDLRKYGRSLRAHQTPNYVGDLHTYYEELDLALERVAQDHDHLVFSAHSTGGLTLPLWLHDRGHSAAGVFLNAPWIDMHGDAFTRLLAMPAIHRLGRVKPMREIPRSVSGGYARSLHRDLGGEWDYDLALKPERSWPVYAGWIRAIRLGQARIERGLEVDAPVLMISSARTGSPDDDHDLRSSDVVLDVDRMRRSAARLSRHLTIAQVPGALHDVTLSPEPARARVFEELQRFLSAYVD